MAGGIVGGVIGAAGTAAVLNRRIRELQTEIAQVRSALLRSQQDANRLQGDLSRATSRASVAETRITELVASEARLRAEVADARKKGP